MIKLSSLGSKVLVENESLDPYSVDRDEIDFTIEDSTHVSFNILGGVPVLLSNLEIEGDIPSDVGSFKTLMASVFPNAGGSATPTVINIEYAELLTAITEETLTKGATYQITNRGDRGLYFLAIADNELSRTGIRKMLCPAFYGIGANGGNTWIGVWNATKNPNIGDLTIWGGLVFESVTGNIGTATTDILLDVVNWAVVPKEDANDEYTEMQFGVSYDVANDWIELQWDGYGNIFGVSFLSGGGNPNYCDISDWNIQSNGSTEFYNNRCLGVFNNSNNGNIFANSCVGDVIKNNSNNGGITGNICVYGIINNSNTNTIMDNVVFGITNNSNAGKIWDNNFCNYVEGNSNDGDIGKNAIGGYIMNNSNAGIIMNNTCSDHIEGNSNVGDISFNKNNGSILNCDSGVNPCNIHHNVNNGNISGTFATHVLDTVVNKS